MISLSFVLILFVTVAISNAAVLMLLTNYEADKGTNKHIETLSNNKGYIAMITTTICWCALYAILPKSFFDSQTMLGLVTCTIGLGVAPLFQKQQSDITKQTGFFATSTIAVLLLPDAPVFQGYLPIAADKLASILSLVWLLNIFDQMERVKNLNITQIAFIGAGLLLAAFHADTLHNSIGIYASVISAASAGFLFFNTNNKKIALGENAIAALTLLSGWLLLYCATQGLWAIAVILPMYYFIDTAASIIFRALKFAANIKDYKYEPFEFICEQAIRKGVATELVTRHISKQSTLMVILGLASVISDKQTPIVLIALFLCSMAIKAMLHADDPEYGKNKTFKELFSETKQDMGKYLAETKDAVKQYQKNEDEEENNNKK